MCFTVAFVYILLLSSPRFVAVRPFQTGKEKGSFGIGFFIVDSPLRDEQDAWDGICVSTAEMQNLAGNGGDLLMWEMFRLGCAHNHATMSQRDRCDLCSAVTKASWFRLKHGISHSMFSSKRSAFKEEEEEENLPSGVEKDRRKRRFSEVFPHLQDEDITQMAPPSKDPKPCQHEPRQRERASTPYPKNRAPLAPKSGANSYTETIKPRDPRRRALGGDAMDGLNSFAHGYHAAPGSPNGSRSVSIAPQRSDSVESRKERRSRSLEYFKTVNWGSDFGLGWPANWDAGDNVSTQPDIKLYRAPSSDDNAFGDIDERRPYPVYSSNGDERPLLACELEKIKPGNDANGVDDVGNGIDDIGSGVGDKRVVYDEERAKQQIDLCLKAIRNSTSTSNIG